MPKSKPACRPLKHFQLQPFPPVEGPNDLPITAATLHVNNHTDSSQWTYSYCDCGKYLVTPQHSIVIHKEEPMTAPDMTGGWKMLDRDEYPDPVITWVVQLPNGEYLEDTKARGSTPTHRIFTDIRDAKEIVISMMLKAKEIGIDNYKPVIITRSVEHQVHKRHSVNEEHTNWIEDNARTLRGEMGA
jgi:hypothetical protein